ncbi:MAG: hypothetical protein N3G74_01835, partial [Candidatus Micrarchaeota archaeon]|nr:hypothetical protein [Candidatus Micrarchaeota archaeon]
MVLARVNNLFIFILFSLYFLSSISFAANCGGSTPCNCGDTVTEDYTMTSDLTCSGTALYIGADDIVLD